MSALPPSAARPVRRLGWKILVGALFAAVVIFLSPLPKGLLVLVGQVFFTGVVCLLIEWFLETEGRRLLRWGAIAGVAIASLATNAVLLQVALPSHGG